jgi:hypothetical protein
MNEVDQKMNQNGWRYGQAFMNVLYRYNHNAWDAIVHTQYDCFFSNEKVEFAKLKVAELFQL